jgi:hypothetical protein
MHPSSDISPLTLPPLSLMALCMQTRDRGEFHNEQALQRLLNNKPVSFS